MIDNEILTAWEKWKAPSGLEYDDHDPECYGYRNGYADACEKYKISPNGFKVFDRLENEWVTDDQEWFLCSDGTLAFYDENGNIQSATGDYFVEVVGTVSGEVNDEC